MKLIEKSWLAWQRELMIFRLRVADLPVTVIGFGGLALLAALALAAKPGYRVFRDYRIGKNLAAAQVAARIDDWATARDKAHSVLLAHGDDFAAYRIWTRALGKLDEPRAYMAAAQLFTDPRATREDRLETLQVLVLHAPQALALGAYDRLPRNLRDQAAFRAIIIPLLIQRGETDLAENGLREVATPGDAPKVRLELLRALCSHPNSKRVAEARRIFAGLAAAKADPEALAALLILGATPGGLAPGPALPDLPAWLKEQPQATARHHLLGMNPALEARPHEADRFVETAIERFLTTNPGVLGDWLVSHGRAAQAASLPEQAALSRPDAYLVRLHALLRLQQKPSIEAALAMPPAAVDLVAIEIARADFAAQCGDPMAAAAAWTRALNQAAFDPTHNRFIEIAHAAECAGAKDAAEDAWVAAIRSGWGQAPLYGDLLPVFSSLVAKGRSDDLLAMFRSLLSYEPGNPELRNNFHYFALIHGFLPPHQVAAEMAKLIRQVDKPVYHSTLMLAEMLDERPADALARLPRFRGSNCVAPMMLAALEGSARVLAADTEAGTALLREVNWSLFMRQERVVFRDLLAKLKLAGIPLPELKIEPAESQPDQIPAWRKAVERLEQERAAKVLPALPPLLNPSA
jgi:hypothetical protein